MNRLLAFIFYFIFIIERSSAAKDECIKGQYHKREPTPETAKFAECLPWQDKTCCTAAFTKELAANQTRKLYGHDWHLCKKLSKQCERFWMDQECFYQCSPYAYQWKATIPNLKEEVLSGVPICASICDRWYEACKTDQICVENVLEGYNLTLTGQNICPKDKPCKTYEQMYGSGKALCENMWGSSYIYTPEDTTSSNCMVMRFAGKNPNQDVLRASKKIPSNGVSFCASSVLLVASFFAKLLWS